MEITFKNKLYALLVTIGVALLYQTGKAQPQGGITKVLWASTSGSVMPDNTPGGNGDLLAFTINLSDLENVDSFLLELLDGQGKIVQTVGEYAVKKHEKGFYYAEEKRTGELRSFFNTESPFTVSLKENKASEVRSVNFKVRGKTGGRALTSSENEKVIVAKVPKFKKR